MRQQAGQLHRTRRPQFDLVVSKLHRPLLRPGTVQRSSLLERLARDEVPPIVSIVAPAGYGKTTLLSQWAERNGQAFAWVSVEEPDNDPRVLLTYIAQALDTVGPIDQRVFDALASPVSSVPGSVVPRLGAAFASMSSPVVLVLDDVHALHDPECRAAVSVLADHVPGGSQLVLAGRVNGGVPGMEHDPGAGGRRQRRRDRRRAAGDRPGDRARPGRSSRARDSDRARL